MNRKLASVCVVMSLFFVPFAFAKNVLPDAVAKADSVVWVGLDFSKVQMIGPQTDFKDPATIFPEMLTAWNELFDKEMVAETGKKMISKLGGRLGKQIVADSEGMAAINKKATVAQVVQKDGGKELADQSDITDKDIAAAVKAYTLKQTSGVGLVFIIDRMVKEPGKKSAGWGALYTVFFDIQTRAVLGSTRACYKAGGIGFRNYWFRPIKAVVDDLK